MKKKAKFQQVNLNAHGRKVGVRRDKRRARAQMTKSSKGMYPNTSMTEHNDDRTGDWREWWEAGCGRVIASGKPACPPGHAYYVERTLRGLHRGSKIYGRRQERRKNKKIDFDE